jgi:hypothetical protein
MRPGHRFDTRIASAQAWVPSTTSSASSRGSNACAGDLPRTHQENVADQRRRRSAERATVSGATVAALELYALHAAVQLPGATDVYGAVVGQNISTSGAARVHFDRAILDTSNGCSVAPPPVCDSCEQCTAGLACVAGTCGPRTRDADCCEPMVCASGTCQPLSLPTP